jgi:hypothetical protein
MGREPPVTPPSSSNALSKSEPISGKKAAALARAAPPAGNVPAVKLIFYSTNSQAIERM